MMNPIAAADGSSVCVLTSAERVFNGKFGRARSPANASGGAADAGVPHAPTPSSSHSGQNSLSREMVDVACVPASFDLLAFAAAEAGDGVEELDAAGPAPSDEGGDLSLGDISSSDFPLPPVPSSSSGTFSEAVTAPVR